MCAPLLVWSQERSDNLSSSSSFSASSVSLLVLQLLLVTRATPQSALTMPSFVLKLGNGINGWPGETFCSQAWAKAL
jgi:hypothetical protein